MARNCIGIVVVWIFCAGQAAAQDALPEPAKTTKEHEFLRHFVGTWECDGEAFIEPGKPPMKLKSKMKGQLIGNFWAAVVVTSDASPQPYHGQGTFGYDSRKQKYIGTWADSMSDFLWRYEGTVEGTKLVFDSEGPHPTNPAQMVKARDTWDFTSEDVLLLTSEMEGPDGKLITVMKATCKRKD